jgi:hypothetical protein
MPTSTPSTEVPWTTYVEALLSWRRFVAWGVLGSWLVILAVGLSWPRVYECEATLSFPPLYPRKAGEPTRSGIPIPLFKRFTKALSDEAVLARGLSGTLGPGEIPSLRQSLETYHIAAVTTSPLGDTQRMTREDAVIGVKIAYSGRPSEKAAKAVTALAGLCRDTLARVYALQLIEERTAQNNDDVKVALAQSARFKVELESLERQKGDLSALARDFPGEGGGGRQVVDTREGGQLYLPARVQLMGIRAMIAEHAHEIRVREHFIRLGALRQQFLGALSQRLDGEGSVGAEATDVVRVVRDHLEAFVAAKPAEESDLAILRAEGDNLASTLASCAQATALAQPPAVRRKPRATAMATAGAAAAVFVLLAALLGESWRRLHPGA